MRHFLLKYPTYLQPGPPERRKPARLRLGLAEGKPEDQNVLGISSDFLQNYFIFPCPTRHGVLSIDTALPAAGLHPRLYKQTNEDNFSRNIYVFPVKEDVSRKYFVVLYTYFYCHGLSLALSVL